MCNPRISNLVPFVALALSKQRKYRIALTKKRTDVLIGDWFVT